MRSQKVSPRLRYPAHAHIDFRNLIPGRVVDDSGLGEIKDALEYPDSLGGARTIDAVRGDAGNGGIILGDAVQLLLDLQHLIPGGSDAQVITGPRGGDAGDGDSGVDIHVAAIVVADDLDRGVTLVAQIFGAPLA